MIPANALGAVTAEELSKAATLFGTLKQLRLRLTNADENALDRAFETHVQGVLEKLESRLPTLANEQLQTVEVVMARHGLYDAAFQQSILLCQNISPALGDSLKDLRSTHSRFITDLQQVIGVFVVEAQRSDQETKLLREGKTSAEKDCNKIKEALILLDKEADDHQRTILDLRQKLRASQVEVANLHDIITSSSLPFPNQGKKKQTTGVLGGGTSDPTMKSPNPPRPPDDKAVPNRTGAFDGWLFSFRADLQRTIDEDRCREISLKECKEFIDKLYESKAAANAKLAQGLNTPVETVELHMYKVLEKKYGLRSIAVEHAAMILYGIEKFAPLDNEVNVFQKTFRNEIEEDFWLVQKELRKSIRDLCMVQLMGRFPTKDQGTLTSLLEQKMEGIAVEEEWTEIVKYLYNTSDSAAICLILKRMAREFMIEQGLIPVDDDQSTSPGKGGSSVASDKRSSSVNRRMVGSRGYSSALSTSSMNGSKLGYNSPSLRTRSASSGRGTKGDPKAQTKASLRLPFPHFIKCVLDFQLKSHTEYLNNFRRAFQRMDGDGDGILTSEEFQKCFMSLRTNRVGSSDSGPSPEMEDNDLDTFDTLLQIVDPHGTDRITFSCAASILNKIAQTDG